MINNHSDKELDNFLREVDEMTHELDDFISGTRYDVTSRDMADEAGLSEPVADASASLEAGNLPEFPHDHGSPQNSVMHIPPAREGRRLYPSGRIGEV